MRGMLKKKEKKENHKLGAQRGINEDSGLSSVFRSLAITLHFYQ
jgi:hypothetical protein